MFEWKSEYGIQIPEIDAQHQRLFGLAAELHAAVVEGQPKTSIERLIARVVDHAQVHFGYEERLMRKYLYPAVAAHQLDHEQLMTRMLDLQKAFQAAEKTLSFELLLFLQNWLEHHIKGPDQEYGAFIRGERAA